MALLATGVVLGTGSRVVERRVTAAVLAPLGELGSAIMIAALMAAVLLAAIDLVALAARLAARPFPAKAPPPAVPERRAFIAQAATGSALAVATGSSFYGTFFGRHDYVIEDLPVRLHGLSPRIDGYTLVQLSDVHLGLFVGEPEARAAEALIE